MTIDIPITLPTCGHCNALLRHDAELLCIERGEETICIAAEHSGCLSEWGLAYENGTIYHCHEATE